MINSMKSALIIAGVILAALAAAVLIHIARYAAQDQQPARPAYPAMVTDGGRVYQCSQVRLAWDDGNMDAYDSYPADVQLRCIAG